MASTPLEAWTKIARGRGLAALVVANGGGAGKPTGRSGGGSGGGQIADLSEL